MSERIEKIEEIDGSKIDGSEHDWARFDGHVVVTDKQRIMLGISNGQSCCEQTGYFWCNEKPEDFVGAELLGVTLTDKELNTELFKSGCNDFYEGGVMFVNFETDRGVLQFVAYNSHNGYYGHEAIVSSEQLTHSETL